MSITKTLSGKDLIALVYGAKDHINPVSLEKHIKIENVGVDLGTPSGDYTKMVEVRVSTGGTSEEDLFSLSGEELVARMSDMRNDFGQIEKVMESIGVGVAEMPAVYQMFRLVQRAINDVSDLVGKVFVGHVEEKILDLLGSSDFIKDLEKVSM
jgi:hypothetical protein